MENKFNYYYYDIFNDEEDMIKDILHLRVLEDCPGICLDINFLDFVPDELNKN